MPNHEFLPVKSLHLDLRNYRTIPQPDETHAINTMISINPDRFWALLESLLEDGYHPTENIIVQKEGGGHVVKEGNRRIAALKIILKYVDNIDIPDMIKKKVDSIGKNWKTENTKVPCSVYDVSESKLVGKIVALTHAKGEKAGRDKWNAVAKARHGRDEKSLSEPGLDLLEKYLEIGRNLSPQQAERWSGEYPLTVLDEAVQKIAPIIGFSSARDLATKYPKQNKMLLDKVLHDIGVGHLGFAEIRDKNNFFGKDYGIVIPNSSSPPANTSTKQSGLSQKGAIERISSESVSASILKRKSVASNDPKSVHRKLASFKPKGANREKVVTLLNEAKTLKIEKHPHAFCFILRSMFELSGKAYCHDYQSSGGPSTIKPDGNDRELKEVLKDIVSHMTNNSRDKNKVRELHGAIAELSKQDGILSVTSLNQLIHNPSFSISPPDISIMFGNIFPLLDEMNK